MSSGQVPLAMHEDTAAFKIYMADASLLSARSQLDIAIATDIVHRKQLDLGGLVENYVAQSLASCNTPLRYWTSENTAEVDFIIQTHNAIAGMPIEVKSSDNTQSRSLSVYQGKYHPSEAIRLSTKNFGRDNHIRSVPLYAAFCIGQ